MKSHPLRIAALASMLATAPSLALAEPGDMMHMSASIRMQIANVQMNIPAQTFSKDICVSKQHDARDIVRQSQRNKDCTVTDYRINGASGSFHYACSGQMSLAGDGSFEAKAGGGSHVNISAAGNVHGQSMTMNLSFETTPAGASCEYTPPAAASH
ncbi:MAG TPA: DUF3617 family protein [Xanthomonadaceae bacterium]|jgi:hypothetical protein